VTPSGSPSLNNKGDITMAAWVNIDATGNGRDIAVFDKSQGASSGYGMALLIDSAGAVKIRYIYNGATVDSSGSLGFGAGAWHHIAVSV